MLTPRSLMFAAVAQMNVAFGNPVGLSAHLLLPKDHAVFQQCMTTLKQQVKNIPVEYDELMKAIAEGNVDKIRDGLCDIIVFALGAFHKLGLDADDDMRAVLEGVMTRFCHNEADVKATAEKWAALGVTDLVAGGQYPNAYVKAASDVTSTEGEFIPKGKFLKSVNNRDPIFTPIPTLDQYELPHVEPIAQVRTVLDRPLNDAPLETSEADATPRTQAIGQPTDAPAPARKFLGAPVPAPQAVKAPEPVVVAPGGCAPPVGFFELNGNLAAQEQAVTEAWALVRAKAFEQFVAALDNVDRNTQLKILSGMQDLDVAVQLKVNQQ